MNNDNTVENFKKDKLKVLKYGEEIDQMHREYDEYREKDPELFNSVSSYRFADDVQKVKSEVDFALLRISEKRYKAEQEVESLKQVITKKNAYIRELEIKLREFKQENNQLKDRVKELEEDASENPKPKKVGSPKAVR